MELTSAYMDKVRMSKEKETNKKISRIMDDFKRDIESSLSEYVGELNTPETHRQIESAAIHLFL